MKQKKDKSVDELLLELGKIEEKIMQKPRVLKSDGEGNLLLDPSNKNDVEWYENDEEYNVTS